MREAEVRFPATWSRSLWVTTVLVSLLIAGGAALVTTTYWHSPWVATLESAAIILPWLLTWALAPRGFAVSSSAFRVLRPCAGVAVPLSEIRSVRVLGGSEARRLGLLGGSLRVAGSGGLFGYFGRFRTTALGRFKLYATRGDAFVLIETERGLFVITPDDPARFASALEAVR